MQIYSIVTRMAGASDSTQPRSVRVSVTADPPSAHVHPIDRVLRVRRHRHDIRVAAGIEPVDDPRTARAATRPVRGALASALQRAFAEAGDPSIAAVAVSDVGVSQEQIFDWRAGQHVPSRFSDLEPVIAYLQATAHRSGMSTAPGKLVTSWPNTRWQQAWRQALRAIALTPETAPRSA